MTTLSSTRFHPLHDDFQELRGEALRRLVFMAVALAIGLLCIGLVDHGVGRPEMWVVVVALIGPVGPCLWFLPRYRTAVALSLYVGLMASALSAAVLYSSPTILFVLPLGLMVFPMLVGYRGTCGLAVVTIGLLRAAPLLELPPIPDDIGHEIIALLALSLGLSWLAYQPIATALDWAWVSYQAEQRKTDEVRSRQAELAQTSKSLTEACERLEQVNLELSDARRMAEETRRLKDQFVTTISHELRTPLNLIIGFSEVIVNGPSTGAPSDRLSAALARDLETIHRNACHLSTLVDDVLDLGRLEAHRLALRKDWSNLATIVDDAVDSVAALYERAGLNVSTSIPKDLPDLYLDPTRVRQVMINLLANAVRYIEEGGVRVTAGREGGDVIVAVTDTGVGIPPDDLPYVFEPFRQTGQLRRRGGFGLGLTVSKQFVEMHGGSMWVESQLHLGTTFRFTLPVTDNVAAAAPGTGLHRYLEAPQGGEADRTILLVDRDPEATRVFERYLDDYRVVTAASAGDAARIARKERFSAVIVPTNGASALDDWTHLASAQYRQVPVVRCTLRTGVSAGHDLGAAAFLSKPVRTNEIVATVRRLRLHPRRILIIDDDPEMVRLLETTLRRISPKSLIQSAEDGEQGLRVAEVGFGKKPPDLVFLDLLMPRLDGHGFLRIWREDPRLSRIPVVVVSAASENDHDAITCESLHLCRDGGFTVGEMIQVIRGGLGGLAGLPSGVD